MHQLARIFTLFDKYDEAEKYISQFQSASAYNNLGNIYFLKNQPDKAVEYYQKSIELDPTDGGVYLNAGLLYYLNGNPEKAEEMFAIAISKFDSPEKAYEVLGIEDILRELGQVAAEKPKEKQISKEELRNLILQASKKGAGRRARREKEYEREDIFEKGQNIFVFGGRRGADPTQLQTVKSLLYWKF
jgi:tetratricopeptide (TPR) repeat protein